VIRAVIDTNVLVSGLLSPSGNEALILLAVHQGLVRPCLSEDILAEYAAVLARPKFVFPPDEIDALVQLLRDWGETVDPAGSTLASPDPGDTKFLQCAGVAGAEFLVTGNRRHYLTPPTGPRASSAPGNCLTTSRSKYERTCS
jgi:putative PIN family toxin of toxin-antitoxin system